MTHSSQSGHAADFLASFCLVEEGDFDDEVAALTALAAVCDARLRYWEIVYVVREDLRPRIQAAAGRLSGLRNLRIVVVNRGVNYYKGRELAVSEAIGDVVVLSAFNEMPHLDLVDFAEQAVHSGDIVIGHRAGPDLSLSHLLLRLISPYQIVANSLRTIALPRAPLGAVLARPTAAIDLRFEPKRGADRYVRKMIDARGLGRTGLIGRRLELLAEIISTSASRFLKGYAFISLAVALLSGCYSVYAVLIYSLSDAVQPGWFSAALVQSGSVGYLALGFTIVSLGLARVAERSDVRTQPVIIDEISNINFFEQTERLNVDVSLSGRTET